MIDGTIASPFSHDRRQHYCRAFAVQQTFYREFTKNESAFQITGLQSTVAECFGVADGIDDVLAKKKSGPPDFMRHSLPLGVAHSLLVDRLPLNRSRPAKLPASSCLGRSNGSSNRHRHAIF